MVCLAGQLIQLKNYLHDERGGLKKMEIIFSNLPLLPARRSLRKLEGLITNSPYWHRSVFDFWNRSLLLVGKLEKSQSVLTVA